MLNKINKKPVHTKWCINHEPYHGDLDDVDGVLEHFKPTVSVDMKVNNRLYEATYKDLALLIDGNFLKQKIRADALEGVEFHNFEYNIMNFYVKSSEFEDNGIRYLNQVQFDQWEQVGTDEELKSIEKARLLLWAGDIRLHCTCPSQLYWGYSFILTILDSSIYPETRFPGVRNPHEKGVCCKHLNRVLRVLPFHSGEIARELKSQFG